MIKFFRTIRIKLLSERKFTQYLLYAVGEIILVVIGILIALQINNWNEQRKNRVTEKKLLIALHDDLLVNIDRLNKEILLEQRTIKQANKIINHLDERKPYDPALDLIFTEAIYSPDITISTSSYEMIKFKGIDIVQNESLQRKIIDLFDVDYADLIAQTVRLENQFWPSSVLPLIHKHFRVGKHRKLKPTNYEALMDDTTYKNMVTHRAGFRALALNLKIKVLNNTEALDELIMIEINKTKD